MKILLLNLYFPPDTSATAKMAQTVVDALCKEHEVTVVCGRPSYDPTERRDWRLLQTETRGKLRIVRVGSTAFPRFNMKKRALNYLSYVLFAVPLALFVSCDAVLAMTDPPFEGIVGAFVGMLKGKPYIYTFATCIRTWPWVERLSSLGYWRGFGKRCTVGRCGGQHA